MNTISEFYHNIGQNFLGASVLYLPKFIAEIVQSSDASKDHKVLFECSNKVFVIEKDGYNHFPETGSLLQYIAPKKTLLDNNVLILLKLKEDYLPHTFKYIFQKYVEQLLHYKRLTKWLFENYDNYIVDANKENLQAFELQYRFLCGHEVELFQFFKNEHDQLVADDDFIPSITIETKKETLPISAEKFKALMLPDKPDEKADKRKTIAELKAFTEKYAESLILQKVFNVRLQQV